MDFGKKAIVWIQGLHVLVQRLVNFGRNLLHLVKLKVVLLTKSIGYLQSGVQIIYLSSQRLILQNYCNRKQITLI